MKYRIIAFLLLLLLHTAAPFAATGEIPANSTTCSEADYVGGSVELEYRLGTASGSKAMANEHVQRNDGPAASVNIDWRKSLYELSVDGRFSGDVSGYGPSDAQRQTYGFNAIFRKSESYSLEAYAERFGHNLSDGTTTKADIEDYVYERDESVSNDFTYNRQRSRTGARAEASLNTPFFASVKVDNLAVQGLLPLYNVGNGNVPYPLDYEVNTVAGEFGYRSDLFTAMITGSVDSLENNVDDLRASRTSAGELSGATRMPVGESSSYRIGGAATYRIPTLQSTAMLNASFARLTSDDLESSRTSGNTAATSWDEYEGDIKTLSVNGALTSSLWKGATSRVYGRSYKRENDSEIEYNEDWLKTATASALLQTEARDRLGLYEYEKQLMGGELNQRLGSLRLQAGTEWENTDRSAYGITQVRNTDDVKAWGQLKFPIYETMSGHIRYGYLRRDSSATEDVTDGTVLTPSSGVIASWFSYMDTASKQAHDIKTGVEWNLTNNLNIALDYVFALDDYDRDAPLGMEKGLSHEGIVDISYTTGPAQFHLYGSVEQGETKMNTRTYYSTSSAYIGGADPDQADTTTAFNWGYTEYDTTYTIGAGTTIDIIKEKLAFQLYYDFSMNDGKTDFTIPAASGVTRDDIEPVNNYMLHNLTAKLTYTISEKNSIGFGYTFSKLDYEDWAYNDSVTDSEKLTDGYYNVDLSYETHTAGLFYRYTF